MTATVHVTRAGTGKVDTFELVMTPATQPEQPKDEDDGRHPPRSDA
jgi:hypothetical protein